MRLLVLSVLALSFACATARPEVVVDEVPIVETQRLEGRELVVSARPPERYTRPVAKPPPPVVEGDPRVAAVARRYLGKKRKKLKRNDCSGLVLSVFDELNVKIVGGTTQMWERAVAEKRVVERPVPGDLAFFDHTWDKNRNGRVDDPLSHIGIVVEVEGDQVVIVHKIPSGVRRLRLHLSRPDVFKADGEVMNDYLRAPRYGPKRGNRLAGQLLRGFARPPTRGSLAAR